MKTHNTCPIHFSHESFSCKGKLNKWLKEHALGMLHFMYNSELLNYEDYK
jgi:hypothetical protein